MGNIGWPEMLMILVVALIIFGPRKLPELGKTIGQSLAQFRRASEDFKRTWEEEVDMEKRRLDTPPKSYEETYNAYDADTGNSPPASEGGSEEAGEGVSEGSQNYWSDSTSGETADSATDIQEEQSAAAETIEVAPTITPDAQAVPRQSKRDWI